MFKHVLRALIRNIVGAGAIALTMHAALAMNWVNAWVIGGIAYFAL